MTGRRMMPALHYRWLLATTVAAALAEPAHAEVPAPIIDEPLFAGAQQLRVHGLVDRSEIAITADGEDRGKVVDPGDAAVISLTKPLAAKQQVQAIATKGSETARSTPAIVWELPSPLGVPAFVGGATLFSGAECVGASGAVPFASVGIWSDAETDALGTGLAEHDGIAHVRLKRPLNTGDKVRLDTGIGTAVSLKSKPPVDPVLPIGSPPFDETLPPPEIGSLHACDRIVSLAGLQPGARKEIVAENPTIHLFGPQCSIMPTENHLLPRPLEDTQTVKAKQQFPTQGLKSPWSQREVDPFVGPVPPPMFTPKELYHGQRHFKLSGLIPGALLEVTVETGAPEPKKYEFTIGEDREFDLGLALEAKWTLKARQKHCDQWSDAGDAVVLGMPAIIAPPKLAEPLYPCANLIRIADRTPGAQVDVYAAKSCKAGRPDGVSIGHGFNDHVRVVPHLVTGQQVIATQTVGSKTSLCSDPPVTVSTIGEVIAAPKIVNERMDAELEAGLPTLEACADGLDVWDVLPGAQVVVRGHQQILGGMEATANRIRVPAVTLRPGMKITARQSVCTTNSPDSDEFVALGKVRIIDDPELATVDLSSGPKPRTLTVQVATQCPVTDDLEVTLTSSNVGVATIAVPQAVIPRGRSSAEFQIEVGAQGTTKLALSAKNYRQTNASTWDLARMPREFELRAIDWLPHKSNKIRLSQQRQINPQAHGDQPYLGSDFPVPGGELVDIKNTTSYALSIVSEFNQSAFTSMCHVTGNVFSSAWLQPGDILTNFSQPSASLSTHLDAGVTIRACVAGAPEQPGHSITLWYTYRVKG